MGGSCHATANGDAAAAQKGAIAKVARQRKIAKVAQLVLNASVYGAGMTCMMIIQYWLVVSTPEKYESAGVTIHNTWKNKTYACSKPPTRVNNIVYIFAHTHTTFLYTHVLNTLYIYTTDNDICI